jgi:hypothetical protein
MARITKHYLFSGIGLNGSMISATNAAIAGTR